MIVYEVYDVPQDESPALSYLGQYSAQTLASTPSDGDVIQTDQGFTGMVLAVYEGRGVMAFRQRLNGSSWLPPDCICFVELVEGD